MRMEELREGKLVLIISECNHELALERSWFQAHYDIKEKIPGENVGREFGGRSSNQDCFKYFSWNLLAERSAPSKDAMA